MSKIAIIDADFIEDKNIISSFGYGGHESGDKIMFSKYMC